MHPKPFILGVTMALTASLVAHEPATALPSERPLSIGAIHAPAALEFQRRYTVFITDDVHMAAAEIRKAGGEVAAIVSENVMFGWTGPNGAIGSSIRAAARTEAEAIDLEREGKLSSEWAKYYKMVVSGELHRRSVASPRRARQKNDPPDILRASDPSTTWAPGEESSKVSKETAVKTSATLRSCRYLNCYMTAATAVGVFFVESGESDGNPATVPQNIHSWTTSEVDTMKFLFTYAASQLSSQAAINGQSLTFVFEWYAPVGTGATTNVVQELEPLYQASQSEAAVGAWVNPIMAKFGQTVGTPAQRVAAFNTGMRYRTGAQRSYSAFVTLNPDNSGVTSYADGGRGWALLGGPFLQILSRNGSPTDLVIAHETVHEFWACDEYLGSYCTVANGCSNCALFDADPDSGPRPTTANGNCEASSCNALSTNCLMKYFAASDPYYMCTHTARQVGWIP